MPTAVAERSSTALAAALYEAMQELVRIYQFRDRDRACYGRTTANECYALEAIETAGSLSVGELAAALGLHKSNASRIADGLVAKRYVRRKVDPVDRRSRRLTVTAGGVAVHAEIRAAVQRRYAQLLARFPEQLRPRLVAFVRDLGAEATERIGRGGGDRNEESSCC